MIFRQDVPSRYRAPVSPSRRFARSALPRERFRSVTHFCRLHQKFAVAHNTALIKMMWYGAVLAWGEVYEAAALHRVRRCCA